MKAIIVIPTYNEKENIEDLIEAIGKERRKIKGWGLDVLVVDDNSPDGTADIVKKMMKKKKWVHLLLRKKKEGLGAAYVAGFKKALKMGADVVFEMDADFSHNPKYMPKFLKEIKKGYEFVIGSRYIEGGGIPDWDITRHLISGGGNFFARFIAGLNGVHDCTSGYRAIKSNILRKIDLNGLKVKGYAFQIKLLREAEKQKAKIKEIPIVFYDRKKGKSKIGYKDILEFFKLSFKIRFGM